MLLRTFIASIMAAAAPGGGTKITVALAPVAAFAYIQHQPSFSKRRDTNLSDSVENGQTQMSRSTLHFCGKETLFSKTTAAATARCTLPGETPPTILVPYSIACWLWKVPCLPVKPWQMTFVCLLTSTWGFVEAAVATPRRGAADARAHGARRNISSEKGL